MDVNPALRLTVCAVLGVSLMLSAPAWACGGGGGASVGSGGAGGGAGGSGGGATGITVAAANAAAAASTAVAQQAAAAIAQLATSSGLASVTLAVTNVSGRSDTTSMAVEVSVRDGGDLFVYRRFIVLRIPLQTAAAKPNALAVALSGAVSRVLVEEIARRVADKPALAEGVKKAADRLASTAETDFSLTPG